MSPQLKSPTQQKTTVSYATFQDTMLSVKQAVLDQVNVCEALRDIGIPKVELDRLLDRLADFRLNFPADFPQRMWHIKIMEGMVRSTLGEIDAAIREDLASLEFAETSEQESISLLNLSEDFFHAGRFDEALKAAARAYAKNPRHKGLACNLAICLKHAARVDEARAFTAIFLRHFDPSDFRDIFGLYASRDQRMQEMLAEFKEGGSQNG